MARVGIRVMIEEEQRIFLKSLGVNRSAFMRQAIEKFEAGEFEYQY